MPERFDLLAALRRPLQLLVDATERVYWPYLLASLVLVIMVLGGRRGLAALRRGLFARRLWTHPSSRTDIGLVFAKSAITVLLRIPWLALTAATVLAFALALERWIGPPPELAWSPAAITAVYTVVLFVVWDASRFALHWAMHAVPMLWSFHQVHHSAEVLTPVTLYRTHPVEAILLEARGLLATTLVTGVFLWAFRGAAIEWQLLGVNAFGFAFNALGANLRHSEVWLRFGVLERWLLSPAQHQVHHGRELAQQMSNYGTWLACWDRMLGTWRASPVEPIERFGLDEANHRVDSVLSALVGPVREVIGRLSPRTRRACTTVPLLGLAIVPRELAAAPLRAGPAPQGVEAPTDVEVPTPETEAGATIEATTPPSDAPDDAVDFELEPEPTTSTSTKPTVQDVDVALEQISVVGVIEDPMRLAGSGQVITEEELERKEPDDIHRVLIGVPGVYVREEDGFGLRPNIGLRGASSDRSSKVTLMEDGILLAPAPYAAPAAYYFPLSTRMVGMQVIKGPASVRFGPNTIGGAVNLQTRPIPSKMTGYIDAAAGMRGYGKLHGFWGNSWKHFGLLLEGAAIRSDGFKKLDGGGETGFDKQELMLKARYNSDPGARLYHQVDLKAGFSHERSYESYLGITDADFAETPYRRYAASQRDRMTWWRTQIELGYLLALGSLVDFEVRAYRHDMNRAWRRFNRFRGSIDVHSVLDDPDAGQASIYHAILAGEEDSLDPDQTLMIATNDRTFFSQGVATVTHVRPKWRGLEQDIEIGARLHHDQIRRNHTEDGFIMFSGTLVPEGTETEVAARNTGTAIAGAFHVVDTLRWRILTVSPGARVEVIHTRWNDRLAGARQDETRTVFVPGIGAHVLALPWLGVLAGVHSGFSPVTPGQPEEVKPERSINYEAGARIHHVAEITDTRVEAIGFFNDYSNITSECTFSSGCNDTMLNRQFNGGRVWVFGAEALAAERITTKKHVWLELGGTYTYTESRFRTSFASANPQYGMVEKGFRLPYVPEHVAGMALGIGMRRWGIELGGSYVGEMRDVASRGDIVGPNRVPRHFVLDLDAQVSITKRAKLYLGIDNMLNTPYIVARRPFGARPGMPFQLMGGFKYEITAS